MDASGIYLYLLGKTCAYRRDEAGWQCLSIQPKPLHLLSYLALNQGHPMHRATLQALFWPDKSPRAAANNLRQALWHLHHVLLPETLLVQGETAQWNPERRPWVDALAFEAALEAGELDTALELYAGPLLPDVYDEWAQVERERFHLRYLSALEDRTQRNYQGRCWKAALSDAETLLAADPLNEVAVRLVMASHWALGQREAARRCYDSYQRCVQTELSSDPLPATKALYQRILRGEPHPDQPPPPADAALAARRSRFSLLETLGAFRQGLEQAMAWAAEADGLALAEALCWQGCFHLRLGQCAEARRVLQAALAAATTSDLRANVLAGLAGVEIAVGEYDAAEAHYRQALSQVSDHQRIRLLSSLGGLQGRMGHSIEARHTLKEAVLLAREQDDLATLAVASGNLGILLLAEGESQSAEAALQEALGAARRADAHWLTAHITGHLGILAADRDDLEAAAQLYQGARTLAGAIGDQRGAALWLLNLGTVRYEQGQWAEAILLLAEGQEQAIRQGSRSLEAGAAIFIGACLVAQGQQAEGLGNIERGLVLAQEIGDRERILIGFLHRGRALATLGRLEESRAALQDGLQQAEASHAYRLEKRLRAELRPRP